MPNGRPGGSPGRWSSRGGRRIDRRPASGPGGVPAVNELTLSDFVGGTPQEPRRRSRRSSERRVKQRRRRVWVMLLVGLIVVCAAAGAALVGLRPLIASFNQPTDYTGAGTGSVQVKIPDGATGTAIGQVLVDDGVVLSVKGFVAAFSNDPLSGSIEPGTYAMKQHMSSA